MRNRRGSRFAFQILLLGLLAVASSLYGAETNGREAAVSSSWVLSSAPVIIDPSTNNGTTLLQIYNESHAERTLLLRADDFKSLTTGRNIGAKITFAAPGEPAGLMEKKVKAPADGSITLRVDVTGVWEAGGLEAALCDDSAQSGAAGTAALVCGGHTRVGVLRAERLRIPFNVKVDASSPDNPEIHLERAKAGSIVLKNEDSSTYPVLWKLLIGDRLYDGGTVGIGPNSSLLIQFMPPEQWFTSPFGSLFQDQTSDGRLDLTFQPRDGTNASYLPSKSVAVKAKLNYWPGGWREPVGDLILFVALLLGAGFSLLVNFALPNQLRRLDLRDQLSALARRTAAIGYLVDSRLRVLLRVERARLQELLWSRWALSPDLTGEFDQCAQGIAALNSRVEPAERLDYLRRRFSDLGVQRMPPTYSEQADTFLQTAADLLMRAALSQTDLTAARAALDNAEGVLSHFGDRDADFVQDLEHRRQALADAFNPFQHLVEYVLFQRWFPGMFALLGPPVPANLIPGQYFDLDDSFMRLSLILDFLRLFYSTNDPEYRNRLDERRENLRDKLAAGSWQGIRQARQLVREMREDIFLPNIQDALLTDNAAVVEMDRIVVRPNDPTEFRVSFRRHDLNTAAAREQISCEWDFGDGLHENGWIVWHYFLEKRKYIVKATFLDPAGNPIPGANNPRGLARDVEVKPEPYARQHGRKLVEGVKLGIALFFAVLTMIAGARDQILKLGAWQGLIAVLGIGFAADTIKNLFSQGMSRKV